MSLANAVDGDRDLMSSVYVDIACDSLPTFSDN